LSQTFVPRQVQPAHCRTPVCSSKWSLAASRVHVNSARADAVALARCQDAGGTEPIEVGREECKRMASLLSLRDVVLSIHSTTAIRPARSLMNACQYDTRDPGCRLRCAMGSALTGTMCWVMESQP
jgi:hypothetical protein